jgi:hypothetical protein
MASRKAAVRRATSSAAVVPAAAISSRSAVERAATSSTMAVPVTESRSVNSVPRRAKPSSSSRAVRSKAPPRFLALAGEGVRELPAGVGEVARHLAGALVQAAGQHRARALQRRRDVAGARFQRFGERGAGGRDDALDLVARAGQALDQLRAARGDVGGHAVARVGQSRRDVLPAPLQRPGHPRPRGVHGFDDALRRGVEVPGQGLVGAADRVADALGISDDRLALGDQLLHERADADLVVGVGALQGGDLAAHQGFELAGAGERPLHPVADGRDLAADGLGHGQDGVRGDGLGLGEADRHLAHGPRHLAQLARPHGQHGGDEEQEDRREQDGARKRDLDRPHAGGEVRERESHLAVGEQGEAAQPDGRGDDGPEISAARWAPLHHLENGADPLTIVVGDGGAVGLHHARGPRSRAGRLGRLGRRRRVLVEGEVVVRRPGRLGERVAVGHVRHAREERLGHGFGQAIVRVGRRSRGLEPLRRPRRARVRRVPESLFCHGPPRQTRHGGAPVQSARGDAGAARPRIGTAWGRCLPLPPGDPMTRHLPNRP